MDALRACLLALLLLPLAGCLHKADAPMADTQAHTSGAVAAAPMHMNTTPAPTWSVGQSWTHKWTIGSAGNLTILVKTVVAEDADGGWTLATDNQTIAAFHGAFIFPTLGHFTRGLLQTVGETRFPWYHFPLAANATWSDSIVTWDGLKTSTSDVQGRVTGVAMSPDGRSHTYHVQLTAKGHPVAEYDYDTATQWFDEARFYDDQGSLAFRVEMQETHPSGFKGRLYDDTGALLLNQQDIVVPTAGLVQPAPPQQFTMAADQNRLLAFLISFAAGGAHDSELVAPDGTRHGSQAVDGVLFPFYNDSNVFLLPGQPGSWTVSTAGAGLLVAGGVVQAYGIHERAIDV